MIQKKRACLFRRRRRFFFFLTDLKNKYRGIIRPAKRVWEDGNGDREINGKESKVKRGLHEKGGRNRRGID